MTLRKPLSAAAIASACLVIASVAHAGVVTLNYDSLSYGMYPSSYDQDGFRTSGPLFGWGDGTVLAPYAGQQITVSSLTPGEAFALTSIDFRLPYDSSFTFTVFGDLVGGGTVSQVISGLTGSMTTYTFGSDFSNVYGVRFTQGPSTSGFDDVFFDNVVLGDAIAATVPEPATLVLLAAALGGAVLTRRGKRV